MRLVRILVVLTAMVVAFSMLGVGLAFAHPDAPGLAPLDNSAPVGSAINDPSAPGFPGIVNGFGNPNSNSLVAIANNPLCPLHPHPN